jgi:hypothetical protein
MAALTRSLDDVLQLLDSPVRKTSAGTGTDSPSLTDYESNKVFPATIPEALGLTDLIQVQVMPAPSGANVENLSDTGSTYIKGFSGDDQLGMSDPPVTVTTGSVTSWVRTVTDNLPLIDEDQPEHDGWAAIPEDGLGLTDPAPTVIKSGVTGNAWTASIEDQTGLSDSPLGALFFTRMSVRPDEALGLSDPAPTVVQTSNKLFLRTIEDPLGPIDDDGAGDSSNYLTASKVTIVFVTDGLGMVEILSPLTHNNRIVFSGPFVEENPTDGELQYYYKHLVGVTVIQAQDGTWSQVRYPVDSDLQLARRVYRGGYEYLVSQDDANALIAAGFGAYLSADQYPYGSFPYGTGPYGG